MNLKSQWLRNARSLAIGMLACVLLPQQALAEQPSLSGAYRVNTADCADIQPAIDEGTEDMSVMIRSLARKLTAKTNPCYERIVIAHDDKTVSLQFEGSSPLVIALNGPPTPWTREDGGHYAVSATWSATEVIVHFVDTDGTRIDDFTLQPDGKSMKLGVELVSSHFKAPIRYVLAYKRDSGL